MKMLLLGGAGQLGFEIQKRARDLNFDVVSPIIEELDIGQAEPVIRLAKRICPDLVVNCAAYTAVDKAEDEPEIAFRVNRDGAAHVAAAAAEVGARMFHISTDYVFGDESMLSRRGPLDEKAPPAPMNVYGRSKLEGEERVLQILGSKATVLRTAWLHGVRGPNFVQTMIKLFQEREVLKVVSDQVGSPTWAGWLAEVILDCARIECSGVFHAACEGAVSWHEFTTEILAEVKPYLPNCKIQAIDTQSTEEAARKAPRPHYSALNSAKLATVLGRPLLPWKDGLRYHLRDLKIIPPAKGDVR